MPPNTGASLQGLAGVGQLYQDRRVFRPDEIIDFVGGADNAPYFVLRSMLEFEECRDEKIRWFMRDDFEAAVVVTAAASGTATTITIKSGHHARLVAGQTLFSPRTGEHLMVNTTPGSTSVSVTRAIASDLISGLAIKSGDVFFVQAVTMKDGSKPVDTYSRQPWTEYNWIEMNRKGWRVSGRAQKIELWGQAKLQYEEEQQVRSFMRELEIKLLWGARAKQTISGKVRTWSGGVKTLCGLNGSHSLFRDFNGHMLTKGSFDAFLQRYFAQSAPGRSKIMLSGYNFITIMNNWAYAKLRINDQATEKFGLSIYKYQSPYGDLSIMPHKLWGLDPDSGRGLGLQDEAWILDLDSMKLCGLPGRADLTMTTTQEGSTELQEHGEDAVHKEINVEEGLKLKGTENFGFISGIAA